MSTRNSATALLILLALFAWSCSKPKTVMTTQQRNEVDKSILKALPEDPSLVPVGADFEGKIKLLAYSLSGRNVVAGKPVVITYYWQCVQPVPGDYKIFVHLDGARRLTLDHYAVSGLLPTSGWKAGDIIRDAQTIDVSASFPEGTANLWAGFFDVGAWKEKHQDKRLAVTDPGKTRKDGKERLLVTTLWVGEAGQRKAQAFRLAQPLVVDGKLDQVWDRAFESVGNFVDERNGKYLPIEQQVKAGFLWDDRYLYLAWHVTDVDVRSPYTARDSTLWTNGKKGRMDVAELFLSVSPEAAGPYMELQLSPANVVFDALFTSHRTPSWKNAAVGLDLGLLSGAQVQGTLNDPKDDQGYTLEMAIPFAEIPGFTGTPATGMSFRVNLFRLSNGPEIPAAWCKAGGDYHNLLAGGLLELAE